MAQNYVAAIKKWEEKVREASLSSSSMPPIPTLVISEDSSDSDTDDVVDITFEKAQEQAAKFDALLRANQQTYASRTVKRQGGVDQAAENQRTSKQPRKAPTKLDLLKKRL